MVLRLPAENIAALLAQLNADAAPFRVTGEEQPVYRDGVKGFAWDSVGDALYSGADASQQALIAAGEPAVFDFRGQPLDEDLPSSAFEQMTWTLTPQEDTGGGICRAEPAIGELWYAYEGSDSGPVNQVGYIEGGVEVVFPAIYRFGRITSISFPLASDDPADCATSAVNPPSVQFEAPPLQMGVSPMDPLELDLAATYKSGTFCTDESSYLDQPVAQTRHIVPFDGYVDTRTAGSHKDVQPIYFNRIDADGVALSGQLQAYAIKPALTLRVRSSGVMVESSVDADFSVALQAAAERDVTLLDQPDIALRDVCFELPPLRVGMVNAPMSLRLSHRLGIEAKLYAGSTLGLDKQFSGGYTVGWDPERGPGSEFYAEHRHTAKAVELTPPRLSDNRQANARLSGGFRATLRFANYTGPGCGTGVGPYVDASLAATLDCGWIATATRFGHGWRCWRPRMASSKTGHCMT